MADIERERRIHFVAELLGGIPGLTAEHRRFLSIPAVEPRWHLIVDRDRDVPSADRPAGYAIGPGGVFALVFTNRALAAAEIRQVRAVAEERLAGLHLDGRVYATHMLEVMLLMPRLTDGVGSGLATCADLSTMRSALLGRPAVISNRRAKDLAVAASSRNGLRLLVSDSPPQTPSSTTENLFDPAELQDSERDRALERPLREWMSFLDPEQLDLVQRNFAGPARFSGPAGTGKSVVALHRMVRFASRNPGPMLFTSFVRTLPAYQRSGFLGLAPRLADRAEFIGLHAWASRLLKEREVDINLDAAATENVYSRVWRSARDLLSPIEPSPTYWRAELDRVIKGRGITSLDEYSAVVRSGRSSIRLDRVRRRIVWDHLYLPYQRGLQERGLHDFVDVVNLAIGTLRARRLEVPFGLVVVDETQDFTLRELVLAYEIAGGTPASPLLLVGDGQQQVYPGGWRLSDAGIPIRGRGAVLRVNYRNREAVHSYAKRIDATNSVDDLDGAPGVLLKDTQVVLRGGRAVTEHVSRAQAADHLIQAIATSGIAPADVAVIVATNAQAERCMRALTRVGIKVAPLGRYDGTEIDAVKVGTVHRAKGMDFLAVFHLVDAPKPKELLSDSERDRADLAARQTFVALTRARDYVWIGVIED
ncbi:UvrD-helicase domain-containing protein [Nocardia rhizosphaerihabitans]|uniref:UvrD-helicase domain-containing protein n=1 Tax=Nocardia rhizosphaerihabitans TaxID=1691570 RepID=UPI00366A5D62